MQNNQRRVALSFKRVLLIASAASAIMVGASHGAWAQGSKPADQTEAEATPKPQTDAAQPAAEGADAATGEDAAPSNQGDATAEPQPVPTAAAADQEKPVTSAPVAFDPQMVLDRARDLAKKPFEDPHRDLPDALATS